jgi:hypothetical protein
MMAWYTRDDHGSTGFVDEASVGLIEPKSEPATRHSSAKRHSWISRSSLSVVLILSNMAWAGICLMLWRDTHTSALASHGGFEADFGNSTSNCLSIVYT